MKFLLDTPILPDKRAIQFSNASSMEETGDSAEQTAEGIKGGKSVQKLLFEAINNCYCFFFLYM